VTDARWVLRATSTQKRQVPKRKKKKVGCKMKKKEMRPREGGLLKAKGGKIRKAFPKRCKSKPEGTQSP